jgi:protocatechuate 3,4-dioxygenase beta subunit
LISGPGGDAAALTRKRLLELGLALPLPLLLGAGAAPALAATPACDDGDETPEQTEGPYYTPSSPRRRSLLGAGISGTTLVITGRALRTNCRPVGRALIDVWQCDAAGVYDNDGYRLRGHQLTDARGRWRLTTIVPGLYPGRTRHIHVKVQRPGGAVLTTQLYFPGERANRTDGIFDRALLLRRVQKSPGRWTAQFDFVLA